jgi:hypothetical protein
MCKVQVIRIEFSTISKISNTNQMLIIPLLSLHYTLIERRSNPDLRTERPATNRSRHGKATTKFRLTRIYNCSFSPYRAVNTHRLGYKNQPFNVV